MIVRSVLRSILQLSALGRDKREPHEIRSFHTQDEPCLIWSMQLRRRRPQPPLIVILPLAQQPQRQPEEHALVEQLLVLSWWRRKHRRRQATRGRRRTWDTRGKGRLRQVPRRVLPKVLHAQVPLLRRVWSDKRRQGVVELSVLRIQACWAQLLRDVHHHHDHRQQSRTGRFSLWKSNSIFEGVQSKYNTKIVFFLWFNIIGASFWST